MFRVTAALLMALFSLSALAAPKAELWPRWEQHAPMSKVALDHGAWDAFLGKYNQAGDDGINRIAYGKVAKADHQALKDYLQRLQSAPISKFSRAQQYAYWVNLYNAVTIDVVLDHYPVSSILKIDISPGFFSRGPWDKKLLKIEGESLSLNDIEHRILRPIWKDPRTHYALNCASLGCPNLQHRAYASAQLEKMLDEGARAFINHERGAMVVADELRASSIYEWFKADFGGDDAGVIAHLKQYAEPELKAKLQGVTEIDSDQYDWSLNDAP